MAAVVFPTPVGPHITAMRGGAVDFHNLSMGAFDEN